MSLLVIAEHNNAELNPATLNTITAARELGEELHLIVVGWRCERIAASAAQIAGVDKVLLADAEVYADQLAEDIAPLVVLVAESYTHLFAPATTTGKNLMPRVAALMDVSQISDIVGIESGDTFLRPIYAGNLIATVQSSDPIKVITVRGTSFTAAQAVGGVATVERVAATPAAGLSQFISAQQNESVRPELTSADIVVSGGRGLGSAESFAQLEALADQLGAAVGATRAAVDVGFVPNDCQVGQTGKTVAPKLYIAVGISGAIQHLAGMKDSKIIVAINKDEEAPIFKVSNYGLVGDLFEVLPQLSAELDKVGIT